MVSLSLMARLIEAVRSERPAGAGRRPRAAGLDRGRRGARRHRRARPPDGRRRARPAARSPASAPGSWCSTGCTASAAGSPGWPRRSAPATPTRSSTCSRSGARRRHLARRRPADRGAGDAGAGARAARWRRRARRCRPPRAGRRAAGRWRRSAPSGSCARTAAARTAWPRWTARIEGWLGPSSPGSAPRSAGTSGRPLLVIENDYELGLYNGDTGVVVRRGEAGWWRRFDARRRDRRVQPGAARRGRDRLRDDDPQEPGLAVRRRRRAAARAGLADPHPRAALHRGHAGATAR